MTSAKPHVVIIGAGFAGINAAKTLAGKDLRLTIIDKTNHHVFQPLLYQVATAGLSPADISYPVRGILGSHRDVTVALDHVERIYPDRNTLKLASGKQIGFDYLLVATGARHSYFGRDDWEQTAPGLKTLEDSLEIRRKVLLAFEKAEFEQDPIAKQALLTFVVVGGGPTGVEMAGAIAELARYTLKKDFRSINFDSVRVVLVEAGGSILQTFSESLRAKAQRYLERLGVRVRLDSRVTNIVPSGLYIGEEFVGSHAIVWAAGVHASRLGAQLEVPTDSAGRVIVEPDLSVPGYPHIFVAGDLASVRTKKGGQVPGMAPGAIQEGLHAAKNILRLQRGLPSEPFQFFDKGSMATVGRSFAIAEVGPIKLTGYPARILWAFVHILYLISFKNRLFVFMQWAWAYVTFQKGARLITGDTN